MSSESTETKQHTNGIKANGGRLPLAIFGVAQLTSVNNKEANFAACAKVVSLAKAKGIKDRRGERKEGRGEREEIEGRNTNMFAFK